MSDAIAKAGLAGLAAFGDCWRGANVTYFTEFRPLDGVSDIANAVVLLGADQEPTLFVSEQCQKPTGATFLQNPLLTEGHEISVAHCARPVKRA